MSDTDKQPPACAPEQSKFLRAPFPWFGGKSRVAGLVWERFGDVPNYVEPFFGSGAVLLARPHGARAETINDADCFVANFWRAIQFNPECVARWADWPVNEADLHARHLWLVQRHEFRERMKREPQFYDPMIAGWWVWGLCQWIGGGWCAAGKHTGQPRDGRERPHLSSATGNGVHQKLPNLRRDGHGVHRKRVNLKRGARGVNSELANRFGGHRAPRGLARQLPVLGGDGSASGRGILRDGMSAIDGLSNAGLFEWFQVLATRLRRVRVCCGDFKRVLGPSPTWKIGVTGVFLDPPYGEAAGRDPDLYTEDDLQVAAEARQWAVANGENPKLRIALCGYEGEHEMPKDWRCVAWKAGGGYAANNPNNDNSSRERIWFSPHCLEQQPELF